MAAVLITLFSLWHRIHERLEKLAAIKKHQILDRGVHLAIWIIMGVGSLIIATALAAVVISREGVYSIVTPETIEKWILEHGIFILAIACIFYLVRRLIKLTMPRIIERTVRGRGKGRRARDEQLKRAQTLGGVLTGAATIIIAIIVVLIILSEVGIDITPLLAGAGVAGIAIGFGAQSIVRDMLRGFLILVQNQYSKGGVVRIAGIAGLVEDVKLW
ncbi:mechanosensitive ion channel domain-containing protein [Chloroflexota bacterium]